MNDETEALKKLLKISEKQSNEPPQNNKPPTTSEIKSTQPISVQDFFAVSLVLLGIAYIWLLLRFSC